MCFAPALTMSNSLSPVIARLDRAIQYVAAYPLEH
jgi:hypothetical protein